MSENSKNKNKNSMNPDITTVQVGIRKLKEITIYPLSIASQLSATEIIGEVMNKVSSFDKLDDNAVIQEFLNILKKNIKKLLSFVIDEELDLAELTNPQLERIIGIVYECNFKDVIKNSKDLMGKMKPLLVSMRS